VVVAGFAVHEADGGFGMLAGTAEFEKAYLRG